MFLSRCAIQAHMNCMHFERPFWQFEWHRDYNIVYNRLKHLLAAVFLCLACVLTKHDKFDDINKVQKGNVMLGTHVLLSVENKLKNF